MKRTTSRLLSILLALTLVLGLALTSSYADEWDGDWGGGSPGGDSSGSTDSSTDTDDEEAIPAPAPPEVEEDEDETPLVGESTQTPPPEYAETPEQDEKKDEVPMVGGAKDDPATTPGGTSSKPAASGNTDTGTTAPDQPAAQDKGYDWIDRVELPEYASGFYDRLTDGSGAKGFLMEDGGFAVDPKADDAFSGQPARVDAAETLTMEETPLFASDGDSLFDTIYFTDEYNRVDVAAGDTKINYASLKEGDVVKTSSFNGVFVTKIVRDDSTYEAKRGETSAYISASYQAFDRDHPEIFWLSGKSKLRMLTVGASNGAKETYFFFVLADSDGFTLRGESYQAPGSVDAGIAKRDAAVKEILATVNTSASRRDQVAALNKWLTEHNAYNSSADLTAIGNDPHECLVALVGTVGETGPVCDGYSRAFKVLCDRLGIPCVLADGYARTGPDHEGEFHMWNNVRMDDGAWYGVDVTWDDPVVKGQESVAVSGYENENFLLVGKDTEIRGLTFAVSHPEADRVTAGNVVFSSGLQLSPVAYAPMSVTPAKVVLSPQKLSVDGKNVDCEKYNIDGRNYFKLRDLAQLLSGTGSQFGVGYDAATATVTVTSGAAYTPNGTELKAGVDNSSTAQPSRQTILIDGEKRGGLTVYNIGGSNFFQLRELGSALGFEVDYDAASNTAIVRSAEK